MKRIIKETDQFIVQSESIVTSFDRKIITRLYQPLIGAIAGSLFYTLLSELEFDNTISKEKKDISSLLNLMNISIGDFLLSTSKLEGTGLIKSQYSKAKNYYVFSIFAPLSPKDFFDNPLFDSLIQKQLGENEYQRNKMYFNQSSINPEDLEDVSDDFDDVFSFDGSGKYEGGSHIVSKKTGNTKIHFNYEVFYMRLDELQIDKKCCKDVEEEIALIAVANKVPAVDIASLIHKSLTNEGKVNLVKLRSLCTEPNLSRKSPKDIDTGNPNLNKKIELYNKTNPYEFLVIKNNYAPISTSDKRIIDSLINEYHLEGPVVNVLVDYVLQVSDNKLSRSYIEKIAGSLARSKISDSYEAMRYLTKSNNTSISKVELVEENKPSNDEPSKEDVAKALAELQALKKARDK